MEDAILNGLLSLLSGSLPDVALCINGIGGVVIEVVHIAIEAVVQERILPRIVVIGRCVFSLSDIDVFATNNGNPPEVALYPVASNHCVLRIIRVVDVDAATAIHRVRLVVVVLDGVVADNGILRDIECQTKTVVVDVVVLDERVQLTRDAHHIGHHQSAYHGVLRIALNLIVADNHLCTDSKVQLRVVAIRHAILDELAVLYGQIDGYIGSAANG